MCFLAAIVVLKLVLQDLTIMTACCQTIVDSIEKKYPELIRDVSDFISELQKITMLNEEKWLFVLSSLDHEMIKRVKQLDSERVKMDSYKHLTDEQKKEIHAEKTELVTSMVRSSQPRDHTGIMLLGASHSRRSL